MTISLFYADEPCPELPGLSLHLLTVILHPVKSFLGSKSVVNNGHAIVINYHSPAPDKGLGQF